MALANAVSTLAVDAVAETVLEDEMETVAVSGVVVAVATPAEMVSDGVIDAGRGVAVAIVTEAVRVATDVPVAVGTVVVDAVAPAVGIAADVLVAVWGVAVDVVDVAVDETTTVDSHAVGKVSISGLAMTV